jgi:lysophospholipase L1-like esterase
MSKLTLKPHSVILFQGDSITDAGRSRQVVGPTTGDKLGFGYARLVADHLQTTFQDDYLQIYNRGISGDRIHSLADRWEKDTLQLQPDLISILIGINDTINFLYTGLGASPKDFQIIFQEILDQTRQRLPSVQLVLCEPFILPVGEVNSEWKEDLQIRQEGVRGLAKQYDAAFVPFQSVLDQAATKTPPHQLLDDGVHPTQRGHRIMADSWLKTVLSI